MVGNTGYTTKALPGMPYFRMMLIESDMTRWFSGVQIDFMEPMLTQPSWEKLPGTHFTGFPDFQLSKENHLLADQE